MDTFSIHLGRSQFDEIGTFQHWPIKDLRTVQELLGHDDVATTQIYTHVMKKPGRAQSAG